MIDWPNASYILLASFGPTFAAQFGLYVYAFPTAPKRGATAAQCFHGVYRLGTYWRKITNQLKIIIKNSCFCFFVFWCPIQPLSSRESKVKGKDLSIWGFIEYENRNEVDGCQMFIFSWRLRARTWQCHAPGQCVRRWSCCQCMQERDI